jgi:transcriptional regulator with XRE-family HTH domain
MEVLGKRLKWLRNKERYSQKEMADLIGMTASGYQKIENSERDPKLDVVIKLCDIFKVSADFLLGRSDDTRLLKELGNRFFQCQKEMVVYQQKISMIQERITSTKQELFDQSATDSNKSKGEYLKAILHESERELEYLQYNFSDVQMTRNQLLFDYILEIYSIPSSIPEKDSIVKSFLPLELTMGQYLDNGYTIRLKSLNGTDIGLLVMAQNVDNIEETLKENLKKYKELLRIN